MSIFGALTTAISGLTAQSKSLGNISDNVANSQTVGYKRVDTNFVSYITQSTNVNNEPGTVIARPGYTNDVQGPTQTSDNPLALAIGGQGMFSVALANGSANNQPTFDDRQFYTRAGNFAQDANGYLVNSSGYYLQGWPSNSTTGNPDRTTLKPIQVSQQTFNPIATTEIDLSANLPAAPAGTAFPVTKPVSTQVQIYDSLGTQHLVTLEFTNTNINSWRLNVSAVGDVASPSGGNVDLAFGAAGGAPAGTIGTLTNTTGSLVLTPGPTADQAAFTFTADFGQGSQDVTVSLGTFAKSNGVTQYANTQTASADAQLSVHDLKQNGVALGSYSGLSININGDVSVNYDNGQSRVVARVPLVTFKDVDKLQRLDGQAFMRTVDSGEATVTDPASNGAGKLVTGSIETSNVDIASEFTKMIVAQRAYSANTKVVTTADQMLQDTISMSR